MLLYYEAKRVMSTTLYDREASKGVFVVDNFLCIKK